jgi:hypothetical protein
VESEGNFKYLWIALNKILEAGFEGYEKEE